jgi:hypothetical protein
MSHSILVNAERESAQGLRELVVTHLPKGFELAGGAGARGGLNVDPVSIALIGSGGAIVSSLITSLATVWVERLKQKGSTKTPTITVATHTKEVTIRIERGVAESVASAKIPEDPALIVEVSLGTE